MAKEKAARAAHLLRTHMQVAACFDVRLDTVKNWAKQGMPGKKGEYHLGEIAKWLYTVGPRRPPARELSKDESGDSEGLERLRLAKAKMAELELAEKRNSVLPREAVRVSLGKFASILRRLGDRLTKQHGPSASAAFDDAITECQDLVDHEFGSANVAGSSSGGRSIVVSSPSASTGKTTNEQMG